MREQTQAHTPGPWRVGTGNSVVAESDVGTWSDAENRAHYGGALIAESIRSLPNARLIAAAPELLEACKAALLELDTIAEYDTQATQTTLEILRKIVAKATGTEDSSR